jgi:tetratricopeptide (TPR) repeat protein
MKKILTSALLILFANFLFAQTTTEPTTETKQYSSGMTFVEELQNILNQNNLEEAINLFNFLSPELKNDTNLQIIHASLLLSANKTSQAMTLTDELLAKNPDDIALLELKANIAVAANNSQVLKATVAQLLQKDPNNATANIIKGNQYALQKKYKLAADYYKKALESDAENLEALFGFAKMSYYKGSLKDSQNYFSKVLISTKGKIFLSL